MPCCKEGLENLAPGMSMFNLNGVGLNSVDSEEGGGSVDSGALGRMSLSLNAVAVVLGLLTQTPPSFTKRQVELLFSVLHVADFNSSFTDPKLVQELFSWLIQMVPVFI